MAGIIRIVFGVLFLLAGIFFLLTIFGFLLGLILLILGIILVASGASARGDNERITRQQEQTNLLLQQQIALWAAQANRAAYPPQYAPIPAPPPAPSAGEWFRPVCGQGNLRASAFCAKCGKPLPPPHNSGKWTKPQFTSGTNLSTSNLGCPPARASNLFFEYLISRNLHSHNVCRSGSTTALYWRTDAFEPGTMKTR